MSKLIAELGSACDGGVQLVCATIEELANMGVRYVKLQCHKGQVIPRGAKMPHWSLPARTMHTRLEYLRAQEFSQRDWEAIARCCRDNDVTLVVSPFSVEAVGFVAPYVGIWKIASGRALDRELRREVHSHLGRPIIVSSGMASPLEVYGLWGPDADVLLCSSHYPTPPESSPVLTQPLWDGYSSHEGQIWAPIAAAVRGAKWIEVHVRPTDLYYGTDSCAHALTIKEMRVLAQSVAAIELARTAEPEEVDPDVKRAFAATFVDGDRV